MLTVADAACGARPLAIRMLEPVGPKPIPSAPSTNDAKNPAIANMRRLPVTCVVSAVRVYLLSTAHGSRELYHGRVVSSPRNRLTIVPLQILLLIRLLAVGVAWLSDVLR
jgi:hypothetical protein